MNDREVMAVQIGRRLRSPAEVVVRCHLGLPVVSRVPPLLEDGTPFPTSYWLSCPLAVRRIGRLEADGGVQAMEDRALADPEFGSRLDAAHARYREERDGRLPAGASPRPTGGVGGARRGGKCLHAHYADHAAGHDNPVGEDSALRIEPLDCVVPCVIEAAAGVIANPEWREPR
ncbi:MAG TPA: DUF501 domain-containing protein [Actinobacteria bacterium]|nr:DUF501 domain-containing protein [Actinomycetota bacterium]